MLEIIALCLLCIINRKNALRRGRRPGRFIVLTLLLWLVPEFLAGFLAGMTELELFAMYGLALLAAALGGLASFLIARNCAPGDYVPPQKQPK